MFKILYAIIINIIFMIVASAFDNVCVRACIHVRACYSLLLFSEQNSMGRKMPRAYRYAGPGTARSRDPGGGGGWGDERVFRDGRELNTLTFPLIFRPPVTNRCVLAITLGDRNRNRRVRDKRVPDKCHTRRSRRAP